MDIENMSPKSGRALKENNTVVNVAELIESINTKIDTLDAVMDDIKTAVEGTLTTTLSGSSLEIYGATVADRPAANTVPIGAVFMAVNSQDMWQSNGTDWVVI